MLFKNSLIAFASILWMGLASCSFGDRPSGEFYVDPVKGDDQYEGTLEKPFRSLDKALEVVSERVMREQLSDKIYLRGGVYRDSSEKTSYWVNLKGTPEDYALISAMPCEAGTPGCVQRQSGKWYEKVVLDASHKIENGWNRVEGFEGVWSTQPAYIRHEWTTQNLWPWTRTKLGFPTTKEDETPASTLFTPAPYMLLQDGQASIWMDSVGALKESGMHTYDHATGTLYLRPFDNKDPNASEIETWYGGDEDYDEGILYLDGEGRGMFHGNMEYAGIVGCEFKMFLRLFEFQRRGYKREEDRQIQRYVRIEDNSFQHGWIHFLLDANTIYAADEPGRIRPRFNDRSNWVVRNNVFYRPSREVFQVHGADHVFEHNIVIDHVGPWAGPAACVGMLNARNMNNVQVRNNCIVGHGNTRYHPSSIFMIEAAGHGSEHSKDGDYIYKGPTYENNLIADISEGATFVLGKGDLRMNDVTIRNNIIATHGKGNTIQLASPQKNLRIENNIFYHLSKVIGVYGKGSPMSNPPLPSTIMIRNNLFLDNQSLFDERFFETAQGSTITIENNWFDNPEFAIGTDSLMSDIGFMGPEAYDFRIGSGNATEIYERSIGPYNGNDSSALVTRLKEIFDKAPEALPTRGSDE